MDIVLLLILLSVFLGILILALGIALVLLHMKKRRIEKRFSSVIDVEKEVEEVKKQKSTVEAEIAQTREAAEQSRQSLERQIEELRSSYRDKKLVFDQLVATAAIYDEEIELAELGFYKPHFDFGTAEAFKAKLLEVKGRQKEMTVGKTAVVCTTEWSVEGSKAKGQTMTNRNIRLTSRAFNNECDAAIGNARWNNMDRMEQRIQKAFVGINKLNESNKIFIVDAYLHLKLQELYLTHEYQERKQNEKEEQAEVRRQMREEAKLEQEVAKALKDEERAKTALDKAQEQARLAVGDELDALNAKIESMVKELEEAHAKGERAVSMAQQTRSGHVYIISNIGSFGNQVYKIGMTRRLEPLDRIKELGDASVPFGFDVHAMIYSQDAPSLENQLHKTFEMHRMNLVNLRREFFKVSLDDIEQEARKIDSKASFVRTAEAREYHESQAIRAQRQQKRDEPDIRDTLPQDI